MGQADRTEPPSNKGSLPSGAALCSPSIIHDAFPTAGHSAEVDDAAARGTRPSPREHFPMCDTAHTWNTHEFPYRAQSNGVSALKAPRHPWIAAVCRSALLGRAPADAPSFLPSVTAALCFRAEQTPAPRAVQQRRHRPQRPPHSERRPAAARGPRPEAAVPRVPQPPSAAVSVSFRRAPPRAAPAEPSPTFPPLPTAAAGPPRRPPNADSRGGRPAAPLPSSPQSGSARRMAELPERPRRRRRLGFKPRPRPGGRPAEGPAPPGHRPHGAGRTAAAATESSGAARYLHRGAAHLRHTRVPALRKGETDLRSPHGPYTAGGGRFQAAPLSGWQQWDKASAFLKHDSTRRTLQNRTTQAPQVIPSRSSRDPAQRRSPKQKSTCKHTYGDRHHPGAVKAELWHCW